MKVMFLIYFFFLFYLEFVFHLICFKEISLINIFLLFFLSLSIGVFLSFITCCIKKEKYRRFFSRFLLVFIALIFCAELVYYKIYESFFSINGLFFITAIKDGYDKVLLTIFQNFIYVILFLLPVVVLFFKFPKIQEKNTRIENIAYILLFILGISYSTFSVFFFNRTENYSMYNLIFKVNMPILNVKNFGLVTSSSISLERKIFGFNVATEKNEDILLNRKTSLSESVKIEYNEENIDFQNLIKNETNTTIKNLHEYFSNQVATEKNAFTGIFENKNVILILAESFDEIAIDKNLTPTLYKLKNEGIIFNNYFAPKYPASTADGEYMLEWATLPIIGENYSLIDMVYNVNPYILPRVLKNMGYKTYVYHDYTGYYNRRKQYFSTLNFDGYRYCGEGINMQCENFHGSDMDMMDQTIDDFINQDKFFTYYITLSGHGSYDGSNFVANKHLYKLNDYNYPSQLKYYMAANIDFDLAMQKLVERLKESGKLDDTVIIISSDHSPYYLTNDQVNIRSSIDRENNFDRNRGSLIIYNSALDKKYEINKYAMNIDVLPTILNMLNIKYDSRIMIGKDIMARNNEGLVIFPNRSWVNNRGSYDSTTGYFNSYSGNVDDKYVNKIVQDVNDKYQISVSMQYNDYYKYIFK